MKIYRVQGNANEYQTLTPTWEPDYDTLRSFGRTSLAASWSPVRVQVFRNPEERKVKKVGDCPALHVNTPVFSLRAVDELADLLEPSGELLPLICDEGAYLAFNVTAVLDVLDWERSDVRRFSSGRIIDVVRFVFRPDATIRHQIFKISQLGVGVFVTGRFVERVQDRRLEGFYFTPVWES